MKPCTVLLPRDKAARAPRRPCRAVPDPALPVHSKSVKVTLIFYFMILILLLYDMMVTVTQYIILITDESWLGSENPEHPRHPSQVEKRRPKKKCKKIRNLNRRLNRRLNRQRQLNRHEIHRLCKQHVEQPVEPYDYYNVTIVRKEDRPTIKIEDVGDIIGAHLVSNTNVPIDVPIEEEEEEEEEYHVIQNST